MTKLHYTHDFACLDESGSKNLPECRFPCATWPYNDYTHALFQLFMQLQSLFQLQIMREKKRFSTWRSSLEKILNIIIILLT